MSAVPFLSAAITPAASGAGRIDGRHFERARQFRDQIRHRTGGHTGLGVHASMDRIAAEEDRTQRSGRRQH